MDALTAVSGSGPAYVFRFAEAMFEGAKHLGFSPLEAKTLVSTTLQGSVDYLLSQAEAQSGAENDPSIFPAGELRKQVTSPGGTTAAALKQIDEGNLMGILKNALEAACQRSKELAND